MSLWNDFVDYVAKPAGKIGYEFGKSVVGGVKFIGGLAAGAISSPGQAVGDIVLPAAVDIGSTKPLSELELKQKAREGIKENIKYNVKEQALSNDLVLKAGVALHDNVIAPYITRPISTVGLITDMDSPLYQSDEFEKGFQLNDLKRAYNRSEKVSLFQALTKSDLTPIKGISQAVLATGGIDLEEVDLWDDTSIQENFVDNVVGRYFTGTGDFIVSNVAIGGAFGRIASWSKLAARRVGLSTKGKTPALMEKDIDEGILFAQGAGGKGSTLSDDVLKIANTEDSSLVAQIWSNYSNNENLIGPLTRAKSPELVRDILLADKGYLPALDRLAKTAPSELLEIGEVQAQIAARYVKSTTPPDFSPEAWARMNAAFDDAINRVPEYRFVRDAFIDPNTKTPWMFGKDYAPMDPIIGKGAFRTVRGKVQDFKAAATVRDFSKLGAIDSIILGNPKAATMLIRFVGTKLPLGHVSFSGSRPFDSVTELNAVFDDLDLFANGANVLTLAPKQTITAAEYRSQASARLLSARNAIERKAVLEEIDSEMGLILAQTNGFFDKPAIENMVTTIRSTVNNITVNLGQKGYAFDHTGMRVVVDGPQTQRQLVESFRFSPWNVIEAEFKKRKKTGKLTDPFEQSGETIKSLYETFNKWWTFQVLAAPKYIPKQSIAEPMLSATMAHGAKVIVDAAPTMTKNFLKNNRNRIMQVASRMYRGKELREVDDVINNISTQLDQANSMLDELVALEQKFISGDMSPVAKAENFELVKRDVAAARRLVEDLELQMLDAAKPFGQLADVPTISNLERRIDYIEKNVIGTVPQKSDFEKYKSIFPNLQNYLDGGSGGLPGTRSTVGFVKTSALKDMPGNEPGNIEAIASYRKSLKEGKGFSGDREFQGEPFNDPIMVVYDNETGLAYVGEGNHRLQAAIAEGIDYVPVRVVRGRKAEMVADPKTGRFPKQIKNRKQPRFVETTGSGSGKPVSEGYVPPEMHPSYVFDKNLVLSERITPEVIAKAKLSAQIANAKSAIAAARGSISTLVPDAQELFEANKKVAKQYEEIDNILKNLGEAKYKQAQVYGKSAKYKERFYGKGYGNRMINGRYVQIESLFDENQYGLAFREEFANSRTASQTYLGDLHEGIRQGLIMRRTPNGVTRVNNPMYFEELAYLVNRSFRGDPLVDQVLAGETYENLLKWATSDAGISYFQQFGTVTKGQIPDILRNRVSMVYRYLPNEEARRLASQGEVRSIDLQMAMAKDIERAHPIQPLDFNYIGLPEVGAKRGFAYIDAQLSKGAAAVFRRLTAPENPIRWASAETFFYDAIAKKADYLAEQGLDVVELGTINTLRSAARREALQQNEKSFYTVNRQNRALYAARAAIAFPTATLNAFYRYGRFFINNPERVVQFLYNYQAAFRSFGIDQYGNPVDDPLKATHLVVPGTKEMGFFGGEGIRLNARSIGFLLNFPTPSIYTSQAVSGILRWKPPLNDTLEDAMGPAYDIAFPYGPQDSLGKALVPVWANDFYKYAVGPESNRDFVDSWNSVHNYYMALNDLGIKKYPGEAKVKEITRALYNQKFRWTFSSFFGVPAKVDIRPNQLFEDYYGILVNKYQQQGKNPQEAKQLAGEEFLSKMGEDFPLDQITFKGSEAKAFLPATSETWNMVFVDNKKLVEDLVDIDPALVSLITLDLDYDKDDFNLSVYRKLEDPNTKLPGGEFLNNVKKTPMQIQEAREVNRAWNAYNTLRDKLEAIAEDDGDTWRSREDLQAVLKKEANTNIRAISEKWWEDWNDPDRGDRSWRWARGLFKIVSNEEYMSKYGNSKLWDDVKEFLTYRYAAVVARDIVKDNDEAKSRIRKNYQALIDQKSETWDPALRELIKRYFEEDTLKAVD